MIAEIEVFPAQEQQIRRRYGVGSDRARRAEAEWFRKNIESRPSLHRKWHALVQEYKHAFRRQGPTE